MFHTVKIDLYLNRLVPLLKLKIQIIITLIIYLTILLTSITVNLPVVCNSSYLSPSTSLFSETKILPIDELIPLEIAKFMFKLRNNLLPEVFNDYFILNSSVHNYNTRNAQNIHPPLNRTSMS